MTRPVFPTEAARHEHMAGAYLFAAEAFEVSGPARAKFAPTLRTWAARALDRAAAASIPDQQDLFAQGARHHG